MPAHQEVSKAIVESLILVAAADGTIHKQEQGALLKAVKDIWSPAYGGMKSAVVAGFRDVKLAQDFGMNLPKMMQKYATLLSKVFTAKEKKFFLDQMEAIARADGDMSPKEISLYKLCREHIKPDGGLMGALKSIFKK
jgi:uncharacterized tellurite resistance protein B-like protein